MATVADMTEQLTELREKAERVVELVSPPRAESERRVQSEPQPSLSERRWAWYQGVENAVLVGGLGFRAREWFST